MAETLPIEIAPIPAAASKVNVTFFIANLIFTGLHLRQRGPNAFVLTRRSRSRARGSRTDVDLTDIRIAKSHVGFTPESKRWRCTNQCLLRSEATPKRQKRPSLELGLRVRWRCKGANQNSAIITGRRFPPPWTVEELDQPSKSASDLQLNRSGVSSFSPRQHAMRRSPETLLPVPS